MTLVVTKAVGGTAKPVGVLYIEPDLQVLDAGAGTALEETGLAPEMTADLLSACLAHERCGVHLYRSVAARTTSSELRRQYESFGEETAEHVRILEELIKASGGDPHYVSPSARATEKAGAGLVESTFALGGSTDPMTAELAMLEAVMLAEAKDLANWELLDMITAQMADGDVRTQLQAAVTKVLAQEEEHHGWAATQRTQMLFSAMTGGAASPQQAGTRRGGASPAASMSKEELYARAQDLGIAGRSNMTKDQLEQAVTKQTGGKP